MNKWLKYLLYFIALALIVAYVVYSSVATKRHHTSQLLTDIEINILDSTSRSNLVRELKVREWINRSGYATISQPISQVDLVGLEGMILSNGFISKVKSYITYNGVLRVDVEQREPRVRLRLTGYDSYITDDGFIFNSPSGSAHYSMVVTGSYKPIFSPDYEGDIESLFQQKLAEYDAAINSIEREKYPLFEQQRTLRADWREFYRTGYVDRGVFESRESYNKRLQAKQESNSIKRRSLSYRGRALSAKIEKIEQKRVNQEKKRNIFTKKYEDFKNLITFVETVEKDRFWASEIVQIIVESSPSGDISLRLIPRSSDHIIVFGTLEREHAKLDKLAEFYRDVLKNVGWSHYSVIDIQYENQVVCR
ncbi:MAG: hypothetical protein SNJ33_03705 [Rikenellaceae bacterium]